MTCNRNTGCMLRWLCMQRAARHPTPNLTRRSQHHASCSLLPSISCRSNHMRMPLSAGLQYIKRIARIAGVADPLAAHAADAEGEGDDAPHELRP